MLTQQYSFWRCLNCGGYWSSLVFSENLWTSHPNLAKWRVSPIYFVPVENIPELKIRPEGGLLIMDGSFDPGPPGALGFAANFGLFRTVDWSHELYSPHTLAIYLNFATFSHSHTKVFFSELEAVRMRTPLTKSLKVTAPSRPAPTLGATRC